jgi:hypothetical protein
MQATREHHHQVREILFGIAEHIFDNARALDPRQGMFNSDADLRDAPIVAFLGGAQLAFARLFFGWCVRQPRGS